MNTKFQINQIIEFAVDNLESADNELVNLIHSGEFLINGELELVELNLKYIGQHIKSIREKLEVVRTMDTA